MKNDRKRERGVALFISIFALLLLTGIAAALLFMATTETSVDSNYRNEQVAYFAAKAGVEEARSRAMSGDPSTISPLPTGQPTTSSQSVLYIYNSTTGAQPWVSTNTYADDELCHDGYDQLGYNGTLLAIMAPGVRCVTSGTSGTAILPSGSTWYKATASTLPFAGTSKALTYQWVRISPKVNDSVTYLQGSGSTATTSTYLVHPVSAVAPIVTADNLICWDGQEELALTNGDSLCSQMVSTYNSVPTTQVYLVTSMGVASNGARKMVQSEIALQPTAPFPYGLYATSTACPAISFTGNNPSTDSYTTASGGTYATTESTSGGDIGTNGEVAVGNGNIQGTVGVLAPGVNCATPVTLGPNGAMLGTTACPSGVSTQCYMPQPYSFPTPPAPSPAPPNTSYSPPSCGHGHSSGNCMTAGTYGNINVNGTLYLAPGVYNINSLSMQGNGAIIVSPPGAVTLNIAGIGQSSPLSIAGNGITDDTIPNDFTINYAGTGGISVTGNGDVTAILNAPLATVTQSGNGNWFGSMVMATASIGGNAFFHYDRNASLAPTNNGYYTMISYRLVPY